MWQRILSGLLLIPLFLIVLWQPNLYIWYGVLLLIVVLALYEWNQLIPLSAAWSKALFMLGSISLILPLYFAPLKLWLPLATVHWLFAFGVLLHYPDGSWLHSKTIRVLWGIWSIIPAALCLALLKAYDNGLELLLVLFATIWASDIGAYFSGRLIGGKKLAPHISPGKTWAGFAGAMLSALIVAAVWSQLQPHSGSWYLSYGICLALAVVGVIGDLFESLLKRLVGIKDSGNIIPGHGGILDRVDSLLAATPVFVMLLLKLEWLA